jgi:presenilin-like A22 family membrane protease
MEENNEIINTKQSSWALQYRKIFFWEVFLFSLTLCLGIISSLRILEVVDIEIQKIGFELTSLWEIILSFAIVLVLVFLIIRFVKFKRGKGVLFKFFFIAPVFLGGVSFLSLWIGDIFAFILISILIIYWIKKPNILVHNLLLIIGMVGVGSVFGLSLDPLVVVFLLAIFSIYDIIAVYKTKHMIRMAKEMVQAGAIPGLILPPKVSEIRAPLKNIKVGGRFLILGGGDIVFPLLLVVSLVPQSILYSIIVALFSIVGLLVSFLIFALQKTRKPIPALPPIATLSIIGYLITFLF